MLFDSWGGVLADGLFQQFSLAYTKKVRDGLTCKLKAGACSVIVFTKGGGQWLEQIVFVVAMLSGWIGRWTWLRRAAGDSVAFQGNLDPMVAIWPSAIRAWPGACWTLWPGRQGRPRVQPDTEFRAHSAGSRSRISKKSTTSRAAGVSGDASVPRADI